MPCLQIKPDLQLPESCSGLRCPALLPVLGHRLSVRGSSAWHRGWAQRGCTAITVAITTRCGTKETQICPWIQLLWGWVKTWKLLPTSFYKSSVGQECLSKVTWSKWLRKQRSSLKVTCSSLYVTRYLQVFKQDWLSEVPKEVMTSLSETTH